MILSVSRLSCGLFGLRLANTKVLEREHLKFAFRNLIPISTCFILGYAVPSTCIFIQYDATMANTLAPVSCITR